MQQLAPFDDGLDSMAWTKPAYSRNQVDKAAALFVADELNVYNYEEPWAILNNWRASHSYPLNTIQKLLRRYAKSTDPDSIVSQRLKRLESIENKLERFKNLQLSQMQDIGGCRAIMSTSSFVADVVRRFDNTRSTHVRKGKKDYILEPKPDGYRGVHLIYQYKGSGEAAVFDKHRVEIQIRSRDQHAWATAVELSGLCVGKISNLALVVLTGCASFH